MSLVDCPKCFEPLRVMFARDGADDDGEVMDVYCDNPWCGWECVDPELGDAVVAP
jgi:hypothetical protein